MKIGSSYSLTSYVKELLTVHKRIHSEIVLSDLGLDENQPNPLNTEE
jgi:hypothetical protein